MFEIGVEDFSLADLHHPMEKRTKRILSILIPFAFFVEMQRQRAQVRRKMGQGEGEGKGVKSKPACSVCVCVCAEVKEKRKLVRSSARILFQWRIDLLCRRCLKT